MCTVAVWSDNKVATVSARNMDWVEDMQTELWVFPRNMKRIGLDIPGENSLNWTSKYGSVIASVYNAGSADGVNEKGLGMHMLWLAESDYGERDQGIPGLSLSLWGQFFIDNFATVAEAVAYAEANPIQLRTAGIGSANKTATVHLQLEDSAGDVAVLEYIEGELQIHNDRSYCVMTNSPIFDLQLQNLQQYDGFGGNKPLPGTTQAADRFVRAAYYLKHLRQPTTELEAVAGIISVLRNTAQPFSAPDKDAQQQPNISPTIWRTVIDHTNRVYYFESTTSPYLIWLNLDNLDFVESASVHKLAIAGNEASYMGECSARLEVATPFTWLMPDATS